MKASDLVGQIFGWLTVISKIGSKRISKHTIRTLWLCKCKCGNEVEVTTNELTQSKRVSCGCRRENTCKAKYKTKIGDQYGYLVVEEEAGKDKEGRPQYKCRCTRCGGETITTGKRLRAGITRSCGCLKEDFMSNFGSTNFRDLTGKQFGYLLVESRAETKYSEAGNSTTMWNCKCLLCGSKTVVAAGALTTPNHTRSCGCLKMSYAEYDLQKELKRLKIDFIFDYSFSDLISPNSFMPLRFDFALFDKGSLVGLIEYQGPQHYQKYSDGFGDFQREITDPMKKEYCQSHNIPLYEIKYDEELIPSLHKILEEVYHTSYDNPVPSVAE